MPAMPESPLISPDSFNWIRNHLEEAATDFDMPLWGHEVDQPIYEPMPFAQGYGGLPPLDTFEAGAAIVGEPEPYD